MSVRLSSIFSILFSLFCSLAVFNTILSSSSLIHFLLQLSCCYCCCCSVVSVVSDSVQPHRWQPTRLPRPWDSPGKNTGVGCHCLLQCVKVKSESEVAQLCLTQQPHGPQPSRLLHPWDFPGKSTGVGCHCLLWGQLHSHMQKKQVGPVPHTIHKN